VIVGLVFFQGGSNRRSVSSVCLVAIRCLIRFGQHIAGFKIASVVIKSEGDIPLPPGIGVSK
jgi:hypothetical protein